MSRRVYLHVGAPKTGTSYLQDRLRNNRKQLAEHGVHYPLGPLGIHAEQFRPALDLIDVEWRGERGQAEGQWDALVRRVNRLDSTVVISHEILAAATADQVRRAMDDLADSEVHVVYSARDLARQIPAEWQEGLKHNRRQSYRRFLRKLMSSEDGSNTWFWRVQGLPDVLGRWSAGLPPDRVHLVTVPPSGTPHEVLWRRFCTVFGIDPAWAPQEGGRENPSMGAAETALVRRLNRRLVEREVTPEDHRLLVKDLLVQQHLARRPASAKVTLPPRAYPFAEEVAERWVEWVTGSGIDVVGDLAELRPVRPPEDHVWVDPDHPPARELVDVALEALAVMTEEAARRPHPEGQLGERVKKAARRLRGDE